MPPRIYLLRHGEALHNVLPEDHSIPDPVLTQKGQLQALGVPSTYSVFFSSLDYKTTVILTSPFRRCLQTTLAAFASVLPPVAINPTPLTILPQLQECGKEPCDTGSDLESTKAMFPQDFLDWTNCTEGWNSNQGFYEATEEKQQERAKWVRRWLRDCKAEKVVVVCHHGFLRRLTKTPPLGALWPNAELREYEFKDASGEDEEADIVRVVNPVL